MVMRFPEIIIYNKIGKNFLTGFLKVWHIAVMIAVSFIFTSVTLAQTYTYSTSGTFTVPAGVTTIVVECWGAGGGGSTRTSNGVGGGGGGGAYVRSYITVTSGSTYNVVVGTGGTAGNSGGNSSFNGTTVVAAGGSGVANNTTAGGSGGSTAASTGDIEYAGGTGGTAAGNNSGGGGGGAGSTGTGGNASGITGGTGTTLNGGNGANGVSVDADGVTGSNYGGGGSGARRTAAPNNTGGTGANGYAVITLPFYSQSSGDPAVLANWNTNPSGGGFTPTNFTSPNQYFIVQTGHTMTTTAANWSVSGVNSRVIINNGAAIVANHAITFSANTTFQIDNGGTYYHNHNTNNNIFNGTNSFGTMSTVNYMLAGAQTVADISFGGILTISGSGNKTMTVTAARTSNELNVSSGVNFILNGNNSFTPASATIDGTVTVQNTASLTKGAGTITFNPGSNYDHNRNTGTIPTSLWDVTSNCNITGVTTGTTPPSGLGQTFGNFTWNSTGQSGNIALAGGLTTIAGNFTMQSTGSGTTVLAGGASTLIITGNLTISGGTLNMSSAGAVIINLSGNYNQSGGTLTESGTGSGNINFAGTTTQNFIKTAGTISNTINFAVNSGATLNMSTYVLDDDASNLATFTLNSGASLISGHQYGTSITGNVQVGGTRTFNTGADYIFNYTGAGAQNTGTSFTGGNNVTISATNGATLTSSATISGTLTLYSNFNASSVSLILNGPAIVGTPTNFTTNNATNLTLGGTSASIVIPSSVTALNNLTINNANGVSLGSSPVLSGNLALDGGNLILGNYNISVTGIISSSAGYSNTHMIVTDGTGSLIKLGTAAANYQITYPVGTGTYYTPMIIAAPFSATIASGNITVRAVAGRNPNLSFEYDGLLKYWIVSSSGITNITDSRVTFQYNTGEVTGSSANYVPRMWNGTSFVAPANPTAAGVNPFGTTVAGNTILAGEWTAIDPNPKTTYYSYKNGNWSDYDTWTLDPSGSLYVNPLSLYPGVNDNAVIFSGRTVTMINNGTLVSSVTIEGILDLAGTTGHTFQNIAGGGKIRISTADNIPSYSTNTLFTTDEGTVEYYGNSFTLTTTRTIYNLEVSMNTGEVLSFKATPYTVSGNLTIKSGTFRINDNLVGSTTPQYLTVIKDIIVKSGASFTVGTGNTLNGTVDETATGLLQFYLAYNAIYCYGNFTNDGTVSFTNQSTPVYNDFNTTGGVSLFFNGASNKTFTCNGTTNLYNLIIDKGSDQSYTLSVYSTNVANFRLFGRTDYNMGSTSGSFTTENPELRKSLWIKNGTLELTGTLTIPSLTEGGSDYYLPSNGALWLNGANVNIYTTETTDPGRNVGGVQGTGANTSLTTGSQSFSVYGNLKVSNGYLTTGSHGIVLWYQASTFGQILVEGGQCDLPGIRTAAGSTSGKFSFVQTGGLIKFLGSYGIEALENYASLCIRGTDCSYAVSGGSMEFFDGQTGANDAGTSTGGIIRIETDLSNVNVTGGSTTIIRNNTNYDNQIIYTTAPFYNLTLTGSATSALTTDINTSITVLNDLTINDNSTLDCNNNNVTIGGDFTLGNTTTTNNAVYTQGTNTTTFNGDQNSVITVTSTNAAAPLTFNNLTIDKTLVTPASNAWSVTLNSPGRTETAGSANNHLVTVNNDLLVNEGKWNNYRYKTRVRRHITNYGTILGDAINTGRITLENGTAQHQLTASTSSTNSFGYIELNDALGALLNTNISVENFYLTAGKFDLGTYNLAVTGTINGSGYSTTKMIQCYGSPASQGLTLSLSLSGTYTNQDIAIIPVGVGGAVSGTGAKYSPLTINLNGSVGAGSYTGTINLRPVDEYHPTSDPTKLGDLIPYYWKTFVTGNLSSVTSSTVKFTFTESYGFSYPGKFDVYYRNNAWTEESNRDLIFLSTGFYNTDYSVGKKNSFRNIQYLYSYQSGNWNNTSTWSLTGHSVANAPTSINDFDVFEIGGSSGSNHQVTITANSAIASKVIILSKAATGISTGNPPSLIVNAGTSGHDFYMVSGGGRLVLNDGTLPSGDYLDFVYNDTAIFEYSGGSYTIPSALTVFPTLWITGSTNSIKTLPDASLLVRKNLNIYDPSGNTGISLLINPAATSNGNITINDSLVLSNASKLVFPNGTNNRTVTVLRNIDCVSGGASDINSIEVASGGAFSTPTHQLNIQGNLNIGASKLTLWNSNSEKTVDLQFYGDSVSHIYSSASSGNIVLSKLNINKSLSTLVTYFDEEFTLNAPTNTSSKPLILTKGVLEINNSATAVTLSSGGANFTIPSTASLILNDGTLDISGNSIGIDLEGKLEINGGTVSVYNASNTNNYIQYYNTGNSELSITGGTLRVGSQIRRLTTTSGGILNYSQSGGTVEVGYNDAPTANRGVLEVLNTGSQFLFTGGSLTIYRGQSSASVPSFYINLDAADATVAAGTTINIGGASGSPQIGIYSSVPLHHLNIVSTGTPVAKMWYVPLELNGDLTINSGASLDANGLLLTLKGDFANNGTFTHNSNTTLFDGTGTQTITGVTTFYNLTKQSTNDLQLASNIQVNHDLNIESGTLSDLGNNVRVLGDVANSAKHIYGGVAGSATQLGIYLNGTLQQNITGSGTYGKITIDNSSAVTLPVGNSILVTDALRLNNGVFDIQGNLLALGVNCNIEGFGFSENKMIQTNVSFTDNGVKKTFPANASYFLLPVGSLGKYTPVTFNISANDNSTGTITVKAANEIHPSIIDDTESSCQLVDQDNVLQYHWILKCDGISGFSAVVSMTGVTSDIAVDNTCGLDETDYITARLLSNYTTWNKYDNTKFDEGTATLTFDFVGNDDNGIDGEYTAGLDDAIPNTVAMYETVKSGDWTDVTVWQTVPVGGSIPAGGPRGSIVRINTGHEVEVNSDGEVYLYRSQIYGTVDLHTTYQHRLGNVIGNGTIRMVDMNNLPAGDYTGTNGFIAATGGTLEYAGTTNYSVLSDIPLFNSVLFTGSGDRDMPNIDISVYGNITIAGPDVNNTFNKDISLRGNLTMTSGTYYAGVNTGDDAPTIVFTGTNAQAISGSFIAANNSALNNVQINKSASYVTLNNAIEISKVLKLTDGNIITTNTNILTLTNTLNTAVSGGSTNSFVNGPLQKYIDDADEFLFPVGKGTRYGYFSLTNTNTTGTQTWKVEYNTSFNDYLNPLSPLVAVSSSEHWQVNGPASGTCYVTGRWDSQSDITPLNAGSAANMRVSEYDGADWANIGNGGTTGDNYNGTIISASIVTPGVAGKYYTLGSVSALLPRIRFSSSQYVCSGVTNNITVDFSYGSPNYDFRYSIDGIGSYQATGLPASSDPFSFTATTIGRYKIIAGSFTANGVTGVIDTSSVWVYTTPTASITFIENSGLVNDDGTTCAGDLVILTAAGGGTYSWSTGETTAVLNVNPDITTNYTVAVTNTSGCSSDATQLITVNSLPVPAISGSNSTCVGSIEGYETESGMSNYSWNITTGGGIISPPGDTYQITVAWDAVTGQYQDRILSVNYTDYNGCTAVDPSDMIIRVFHMPETGPAYYIPNDF
jgi:hypothetical protein